MPSRIPFPERAFPEGRCYCGCGIEFDNPRTFFVRGHDRTLQSKVIEEVYGDTATFAKAHGYGPDGGPKRKGSR